MLYAGSTGAPVTEMPSEIDSRMEEILVSTAVSSLLCPPGGKILCSKRALRKALLELAREAYEIGFLSGQKEQVGELTRPGGPGRPAWMDIRLDVPENLAKHNIRFKPVVLKSFISAGYRCLGDLRWVSNLELRQIHYVGIRTAQQIRAIVRRFENAT